MDPNANATNSSKELLEAQTHVWNHTFSFLNSMVLKCAIELGIPDAIQKHGKPMTLIELTNSLSLHPNKALYLPRLMRILVHSNFFSNTKLSSGEEAFDLNINSQLLLKDHPLTLAPFILMMLDPHLLEPSYHFSAWFQNEKESPFHIAHNGKSLWELGACVPELNKCFNEAMVSDAQFVASLLVTNHEFRGLIEGLESLVDVGGGYGTMAKAIAKVFPKLSCIVFDQPHVVEGLKECGSNIKYVGGDMFEAIPPAQAVLLKWILHDWGDENCIKLLQRCREAIPSKDEGGKLIIIDIVVETNNNTHLLLDMEVMSLYVGGKERNEEEFKKLFINAGFSDYKIYSIIGTRSIIEVYP